MQADVLRELACSSSPVELATRCVQAIAGDPATALARIWLLREGDRCQACAFRPTCPDQTRCLHLVASARATGASRPGSTGLDGAHTRVPLGVRKIGLVAKTRRPLMARALKGTEAWVVDWRWVDTEGIRSFAGLPLVADEQLRGVLAVFSRRVLDEAAEVELSRLAGDVAVALGAAAKTEALERDRQVLLAELDSAEDTAALHDAVLAGASAAARRIVQQVHLASASDASVLIVGAPGTEPISVARAIHAGRAGPGGPFFRIDASKRSTSVEARLFGALSLASAGTLLLENVEGLDPQLQRRLAAWLDQPARPRPDEPSVRMMATTAPEPLRDPHDGQLLPDLLDRLAVIRIDVPPLAARRDDIGDIVKALVAHVARRVGRSVPALAPAALDRLRAYGWPGNLAELHAVLERAVRICDDTLAPDALEFPPPSAITPEPLPSAILTRAQLRHRERESIRAALRTAHGRVSGSGGAAEILGMKPTTLSSRIKALGLAHATRRRGSSGGRQRDSPRRGSE